MLSTAFIHIGIGIQGDSKQFTKLRSNWVGTGGTVLEISKYWDLESVSILALGMAAREKG